MELETFDNQSLFAGWPNLNTHAGWRDEAVANAIYAHVHHGVGENVVLASIVARHPSATVVKFFGDYDRVDAFLATDANDHADLLSGAVFYRSEAGEDASHYARWVRVEWQGYPLELVVGPETSPDQILCFGEHKEVVTSFAANLHRFVERPVGRCLRYSTGWESAPDLDSEIGKVTWDDLVLPSDTVSALKDAVGGFFKCREVYHSLGLTWKRGLLLVGPPGTGKTMICKAIASDLPELPYLYVRNMRERSRGSDAIRCIFERAREVSPCVLVFEDMDGFLNADNRTTFLNEMDGIASNDGMFVVATTNHPDRIDEALLKRPSRFDRVIAVGPPKLPERIAYTKALLTKSGFSERLTNDVDIDALANHVGDSLDGFTPAYIKEVLVSAALSVVHAGATSLDARYVDAVVVQIAEIKKQMKAMNRPDALSSLVSSEGSLGFRN